MAATGSWLALMVAMAASNGADGLGAVEAEAEDAVDHQAVVGAHGLGARQLGEDRYVHADALVGEVLHLRPLLRVVHLGLVSKEFHVSRAHQAVSAIVPRPTRHQHTLERGRMIRLEYCLRARQPRLPEKKKKKKEEAS